MALSSSDDREFELLARVRPVMLGESAAPGKALTALVAAEGFLARVRPAMGGHMVDAGKALAALVAAEGLLTRVRPAMGFCNELGQLDRSR